MGSGQTMRCVLLALDDTDASRRAADFTTRFFGGQDVAVTAVTVAPLPRHEMPTLPYAGVATWPHDPAEAREDIDEALAEQQEKAAEMARSMAPEGAEVKVLFGDVVDAILRAVEEEQADLVVVGSRDMGFLEKLFTPSVSEELARDPSCPVLVVP